MASKKKLLLFGMDALLSRIVFESILDNTYDVTAIVLPSHSAITGKTLNQDLNLISADSIDSIALAYHIPIYYVNGKNQQQYEEILNNTNPDIIIVACFPYKLPALICQHKDCNAFNIHPSCLPKYRGPVPLFWQFYYGEENTGITIHRLTEDLDQGDIVLQQVVPYSDGFSTTDATSLLATTAANMLKTLARQIDSKTLTDTQQNENEASYYSWPKQEDFIITTNWNVARAYNFIKGTMQWGQLYTVRSETEEFIIKSVSSYSLSPCPHKNEVVDNTFIISFCDGCLFAN